MISTVIINLFVIAISSLILGYLLMHILHYVENSWKGGNKKHIWISLSVLMFFLIFVFKGVSPLL